MKKQDVILMIDLHLACLAEQPKVECDIVPTTRIFFKNIPVKPINVFKQVCDELSLKINIEPIGNYLYADIIASDNNTITLMSQEDSIETVTTWRAK